MFAARHNSTVPANSLTSASAGPGRDAPFEQIRAAIDVILAGAANLRHYRDRLSSDDHVAIVSDIEEAAAQIARHLETKPVPSIITKREGRTG